jgi:DNA-binding winged helix-turn-helix (wHTH) protein/tetratricopeptide (TPR) repeat protein
MPEHPQASAIVMIGRWRVDPRADEIEADGVVVKLEPLKMRLLMALAERPGEVVLTQELLDTVWSGLIVTSSSVYQGIAQLRRVLDGADLPAYIETVPRKGYRLVAPVQHVPRSTPATVTPTTPEPATTDLPAPPLLDEPPPDVPAAVVPAVDAPAEPQSPARRRWLLGVAAAGGAGAAGTALWHYVDSLPPPTPVRIAVLPFADHSKGAAEPALSQGLALDVIRALERFPQVDVVAAESALAVGDGDNGIAQAVRRLQVGFVLLGELVRVGARLHVAVRLLSLPGERVRWRRDFEQAIDGVSLLPQVIASEAAAALHLAPPQRPQARAAGPTEAYELYVLGQHAWRAKTPEAFAKARDYYERGIEIDPAYAPNYVGLGWTWLGQMTNGGGVDWREAFARAAPLFDKALRLDPDSAEALTAQGFMQAQAGRYDEARTLFERARQLNPGYAQVHHSYGVAEFDDGWPRRSIPHFRRAAELNPLSLSPVERLGFSQVAAGQLPDAERAYRRAIELEPQHPNGYWGLGILGYAKGALDVAVLNYREALQREARRPFLWGELAWLYLDLGLPDQAAEAFGRAVALLPKSRWPRIDAVYAWVARADHGAPPNELAMSAQQVPEDASAIDVMLMRAMAGLPLDEPLLQRALAAQQALSVPLQQALWYVFQGHDSLLDLAGVYVAMGRPERAQPHLDQAQQQLDRYQRQGNVWHALHFHGARLQGLRGDKEGALKALGAAVDAGCRRGWWLRLDPAFAGLREEPRFKAALARIDADTARQRALLKA